MGLDRRTRATQRSRRLKQFCASRKAAATAAAQAARVVVRVTTRAHPFRAKATPFGQNVLQLNLTGCGLAQTGGIAISGMPAINAVFNLTYAPTGELVEGHPTYSAGPKRCLFHHPERDEWHLSDEPFGPATAACAAAIHAAGGPVPTGA
jgi:hypothetical protein